MHLQYYGLVLVNVGILSLGAHVSNATPVVEESPELKPGMCCLASSWNAFSLIRSRIVVC